MVYKRKTPFKLTRSFVSDLVDRDMKRLTQQQTSKYRHAIKLLPPTYHTMRISGHDRPNAWGTSINDLAFDYFTGFSDDNMSKMVTAFVHEKLKVPLLHINVDHYQNYVMRFWQQAKPSEGLVVDPSGYVTDLYIFQNGTMLQVGTLPVGLSGIRAKLSTQLGIYPGELNSLLALYGKNLLDESTHEKLSKLMSELYQAWEKDFQTFCHHAVGQGDILDYVIWSGNQNDPLLQFFMHAVSSNTLQFPLVFGASRVGFMHVDLLLDVMGQDMRQYPQMQNYDRIIIVGMANK